MPTCVPRPCRTRCSRHGSWSRTPVCGRARSDRRSCAGPGGGRPGRPACGNVRCGGAGRRPGPGEPAGPAPGRGCSSTGFSDSEGLSRTIHALGPQTSCTSAHPETFKMLPCLFLNTVKFEFLVPGSTSFDTCFYPHHNPAGEVSHRPSQNSACCPFVPEPAPSVKPRKLLSVPRHYSSRSPSAECHLRAARQGTWARPLG